MHFFSVTEKPYGRHLFFFLVYVIRLVKWEVIGLKDCPCIYFIFIYHKELSVLKYQKPSFYFSVCAFGVRNEPLLTSSVWDGSPWSFQFVVMFSQIKFGADGLLYNKIKEMAFLACKILRKSHVWFILSDVRKCLLTCKYASF